MPFLRCYNESELKDQTVFSFFSERR